MYKNVAGQKAPSLLAWDTSANAPKTGDAANILLYVSIDDAAPVLVGTAGAASEKDATNSPGEYYPTNGPTQAETNGDKLVFSGKSSTADVYLAPITVYTKAGTPTLGLNANMIALDSSTAAANRLKLFSEYQDYENSLVAVDILNGVAGSTDYENGTKLNPVDNMADAISIAGSIPGIKGFSPRPGSIIPLTQDFVNTLFMGAGWELDAAGFDLSNCRVFDAFVNGGISTSDTQNAFFVACLLWSHTLGSAVLRECAIANDLTLGEVGSYTLIDCYEAHGIAQAAIDFQLGGGSQVQFDDWHGVIEVKNMAAGDSLSMYGNGVLIINANCTGGQITQIGGNVPITDNAGGAVTIVGDAGNYTTALTLQLINYVRGRKILEKVVNTWYLVVFDHTDDFTEILRKAIKDYVGNDIDDLTAKQLAMELKSSV